MKSWYGHLPWIFDQRCVIILCSWTDRGVVDLLPALRWSQVTYIRLIGFIFYPWVWVVLGVWMLKPKWAWATVLIVCARLWLRWSWSTVYTSFIPNGNRLLLQLQHCGVSRGYAAWICVEVFVLCVSIMQREAELICVCCALSTPIGIQSIFSEWKEDARQT